MSLKNLIKVADYYNEKYGFDKTAGAREPKSGWREDRTTETDPIIFKDFKAHFNPEKNKVLVNGTLVGDDGFSKYFSFISTASSNPERTAKNIFENFWRVVEREDFSMFGSLDQDSKDKIKSILKSKKREINNFLERNYFINAASKRTDLEQRLNPPTPKIEEGMGEEGMGEEGREMARRDFFNILRRMHSGEPYRMIGDRKN